jgi:hypothetical protein
MLGYAERMLGTSPGGPKKIFMVVGSRPSDFRLQMLCGLPYGRPYPIGNGHIVRVLIESARFILQIAG